MLTDGVYRALIQDVDVERRTITVDVVETFHRRKAEQAALEDGLAPWKARQYRYAPVYIRNRNPRLRTIRVVPDVAIEFYGACESTGHGSAALRDLAERALPYTTSWYYSLTIRDQRVGRIVQHLAISAC